MDLDMQILVNMIPLDACRCTLAGPSNVHVTGRQIMDALGRSFLSDADSIAVRVAGATAPAKRGVTLPGGLTPL